MWVIMDSRRLITAHREDLVLCVHPSVVEVGWSYGNMTVCRYQVDRRRLSHVTGRWRIMADMCAAWRRQWSLCWLWFLLARVISHITAAPSTTPPHPPMTDLLHHATAMHCTMIVPVCHASSARYHMTMPICVNDAL